MDQFLTKQKQKPVFEIPTEQRMNEMLSQNMRKAVNMEGNEIPYAASLSMQQTMEDTAEIQSMINGIELGTFKVEQAEIKKLRLTAIQGRNLSHLMLNDQKTLGDSTEMQEVKESLKNLEEVLTREKSKGMTEDDVDFITGMYNAAIATCQHYVDTKNPWTKTGQRRKAKVQATLERLMQESSQIAIARLTISNGDNEGMDPITNGVQLLTLGTMSDFYRKNKVSEEEQNLSDFESRYKAKKQVYDDQKEYADKTFAEKEEKIKEGYSWGDWNIWKSQYDDPKYQELLKKKEEDQKTLKALEDDYKPLEKQVEELKAKKKAREDAEANAKSGVQKKREDAAATGENEIKKLPKELQSLARTMFLGNTPSSMIKNSKKPTDAEKADLKKMLEVRSALSDFKPGEQRAKTVMIAGNPVTFLQDRYGVFVMQTAEATIPVSFSGVQLSDVISRDVMNNPSLYGEDRVRQVLTEQKDNLADMDCRELMNTREFSVDWIHRKTGIEKSLLNNIGVKDLRYLALTTFDKNQLSEAEYKNLVRSRIEKQNVAQKNGMINTVLNRELAMVGHGEMNSVSMEIKKEEKKTKWTKDEEAVRNLLADLLFSEDTVEADTLHYKPGERVKNVLMKNHYAIAALVSDQLRLEEKKKQEKKEGKGDDPLNAVETGVVQLFDGEDDQAAQEAEIAKDKEKKKEKPANEQWLLDRMLGSLPLFAMGGEANDLEALSAGLKESIQAICDEVRESVYTETRATAEKVLEDAEKAAVKQAEEKAIEAERKAEQQAIKEKKNEEEIAAAKLQARTRVINRAKKEARKQASKQANKDANWFKVTRMVGVQSANAIDGQLKEELEKKNAREFAGTEKQLDQSVSETMEGVQEAFDSCVDEIFSDKKKEKNQPAENGGQQPQLELTKAQRLQAIRDRMRARKEQIDKDCEMFVQQKTYFEDIKRRGDKDIDSLSDKEKQDYNAADENIAIWKKEIKRVQRESAKELDKVIREAAKGDKGQGLFVKKVLKTYFKSMPVMDQRSMLASALRNSEPVQKPKDGENLTSDQKLNAMSDMLGGMFKGAGPLFQKMLQGLPASDFPEGLQKAIEDTQDNLAHIPEKIVKNHMDGIIARSDGKIQKITVTRSLGAASVGQAFLCKVYGPTMKEGKDVVVKILRPDCRNRMMREKEVMLNAARLTDREGKTEAEIKEMEDKKQIGGMEATYIGNLQRIEEELDLTKEVQNCKKGSVYDKKTKDAKENLADSMKMSDLAEATTDTCMMEMAGKTTLKRYVQNIKDTMYEKLVKFCELEDEVDQETGKKTGRKVPVKNDDGSYKLRAYLSDEETQELVEIQKELDVMLTDCIKRQEGLAQLTEKWVTEGIYAKGYYHGDLHAGNIMISDKHAGVTAIDFGNATELTSDQQKHVTRMMSAASVGDVPLFLHSFHMLLQNTPEEVYQEKREELSLIFQEVMQLGDQNSSGQRIAVALIKAQELGLELPPVIANFSSCQLRLSNALDSMNSALMELRNNVIMLANKSPNYSSMQVDTDPVAAVKKAMDGIAPKEEKQKIIKERLLMMTNTTEETFKADFCDKEKCEVMQNTYGLHVTDRMAREKEMKRINEILKTGEMTDEEMEVYQKSGSWEMLFPSMASYTKQLQNHDKSMAEYYSWAIMGKVDQIVEKIVNNASAPKNEKIPKAELTVFENGAESQKVQSLADIGAYFKEHTLYKLSRQNDYTKYDLDETMNVQKETLTEASLAKLFELQEAKAPQEQIDKAMQDAWTQYQAEYKTKEDDQIKKYKEEVRTNLLKLQPKTGATIVATRKKIDGIRLAIKSCEKSSPELAEKGKAFLDLCDSLVKEKKDGEDPTKAELDAAITANAEKIEKQYNEIINLLWDASLSTLKEMNDTVEDMKTYKAKFEPDDFVSVMGGVIWDNLKTTIWRLGFAGYRVKKKMDALDS